MENVKQVLQRHNISDTSEHRMDRVGKLLQLKAVLEKGGHFSGIYRKVQMKPLKVAQREEEKGADPIVEEALLVLKWGGELTHAGKQQAERLGKLFRCQIYPSVKGVGLLRLHSTYRHDLKCYSSDEGRCLMTAAAFLKGLLDLDGELPPILNSMVISNDEAQSLLEQTDDCADELKAIKAKLGTLLNTSVLLSETYAKVVGEPLPEHLRPIVEQIGNPLTRLEQLHKLISEFTQGLNQMLSREEQTESYLILKYPLAPTVGTYLELTKLMAEEETKADPSGNYDKRVQKIIALKEEEKECICGCAKETVALMFKRWKKIDKDFYSKRLHRYDISKVQDVNDGIRYDVLHNPSLINEARAKLCREVNLLNEFVTPLEFGFTIKEKVTSAVKVLYSQFNANNRLRSRC